MNSLTQMPIGTKFRVKKTGELVILEEIRHFPTRYKTINESDKVDYFKTFEVEVVETTEESE